MDLEPEPVESPAEIMAGVPLMDRLDEVMRQRLVELAREVI